MDGVRSPNVVGCPEVRGDLRDSGVQGQDGEVWKRLEHLPVTLAEHRLSQALRYNENLEQCHHGADETAPAVFGRPQEPPCPRSEEVVRLEVIDEDHGINAIE